jgi:hypothetical protein
MKRLAICLAVALGLPLVMVTAASAHTGSVSVTCTGATFSYVRFPVGPTTITETVSIDGTQVASQTFSLTGPSGSDTVAITVPAGTHSVHSHAEWQNKKGATFSIDSTQTVSGCGGGPICPLSSITSNFNGTAIPGGSTIWFNSVFKVSGLHAPATVQFTNSKITFSASGTDYSVPVPDGVVNFSSVAKATISFDGTNWQTAVPSAFGDNVFLSGVAFTVPAGGLPGGISPVTWQGQFLSSDPAVSVQWQWAAAVYTQFDSYNNIGVKPLHSTSLDAYPNGDQAGTPENEKAFVIGGARGGGGSNFTGSYSSTGKCP